MVRLRGYGNGIVAPAAAAVISSYMEIGDEETKLDDRGNVRSGEGVDANNSDRPKDRQGETFQKDFSAANREIKQQVDPDTQERVELMTKRQWQKMLKKEIKELGEF